MNLEPVLIFCVTLHYTLDIQCKFAGIINGDYRYLAVDSSEGDVFQVAIMNTPELNELMNMYNRSCSHIDFTRLPGPLSTMACSCCQKNSSQIYKV